MPSRTTKARALAVAVCALLCAMSVAVHFGVCQNSWSGERRLLARSVAGSTPFVRQSERLRSEVHLQNRSASATISGPEPSPAAFCFGAVVGGRSIATLQLHSGASFGRAPPRLISVSRSSEAKTPKGSLHEVRNPFSAWPPGF